MFGSEEYKNNFNGIKHVINTNNIKNSKDLIANEIKNIYANENNLKMKHDDDPDTLNECNLSGIHYIIEDN